MTNSLTENEYKPYKYVFGRPREHDRDQIAKDLIDWAKKSDSINLNKFCALHGLPPSYLTKWANESTDFSKAYEYAKTFIGFRREEMLNVEQLHVKAYDLNAKTYDYFLNEQAQRTAAFESSLRKDEDESNNKKPIHVNVTSSLGSGIKFQSSPLPDPDNTCSQ